MDTMAASPAVVLNNKLAAASSSSVAPSLRPDTTRFFNTHKPNYGTRLRSNGIRKIATASSMPDNAGEYFTEQPPTPLLDTINYPIHMKNLTLRELKQLADEVRAETIFTVSNTGGHLGSSLGVVKLTVALHHVFNCPEDKFLWDVGHQVCFWCFCCSFHFFGLSKKKQEMAESVNVASPLCYMVVVNLI